MRLSDLADALPAQSHGAGDVRIGGSRSAGDQRKRFGNLRFDMSSKMFGVARPATL